MNYRAIMSKYRPKFIRSLVYMIQSAEYDPKAFWDWYLRAKDFSNVEKRRLLVNTAKAKTCLVWLWSIIVAAWVTLIVAGIWIAGNSTLEEKLIFVAVVSMTVYLAPTILALSLMAFTWLLNIAQKPIEHRIIKRGQEAFAQHKGTKIAIAGSYGKTTAKEVLKTVLSEGLKVAASPGNMNVALSLAKFALSLDGDEDVVIIEFGEAKPGDVRRFAQLSRPSMGVITGIAPMHLDKYLSLEAAAGDIFELASSLGDQNIYVNADSREALRYIKESHQKYSKQGCGGWTVGEVIKVSPEDTEFVLQKSDKKLHLRSGLLGRHLIGVQVLAAVLALEFGLSERQVSDGISKCIPFEHRMQPRKVAGAWVIDDTYNGNIEGMRAGIALLNELPAKRRIYVTPGLVDQGEETEKVHRQLGEMLAVGIDEVILMRNSTAAMISAAMHDNGFEGKLTIIEDPMTFYSNMESFLATGDVVVMQNDWTDNYS